jgi:anhydro-N-acetylmuramic acid kinase
MAPLRYLGLMSGTSLDGIDVALVQIIEEDGRLGACLEAFLSLPYETQQRDAIRAGLKGGAAELCRLNVELGEWFAAAATALLRRCDLEPAEVEAVGSHGQTIWHVPPNEERGGATLQLGEPAVIAERTGLPVVSDFRARDVAAGGHGAPLVPLIDQLLFTRPQAWRAMQNIGGVANVTLLPPEGVDRDVIAFDTGPGMAVIDGVTAIVSGGRESFDIDGRRALSAKVSIKLLEDLLDDRYFKRPPPKSTGRETYGDRYALDLVARGRELGLAENDLVATATALTARSIAEAYLLPGPDAMPEECIVSGGGAHNPVLMDMLARELAPIPLTDLSALGWDPDAKEAAAFAILAHLNLVGRPGNLPSATGAAGARILGKLTPP